MLNTLNEKIAMGEKRGMKALELWCKRVTDGYPGVKVENMTTSWRDGLAFCALIHHFRPDLIDFSSLKKNNIYGNNELAFRTAERHLGIPALLDAEDMVEYEVPDRLSILTYLSQFYQTFASHPSSPIKRSPDSTDCSLVLSPSVSTPPPKEGRRREPCFACGLPVFLAQRLLVGGRLYHRTCFRCARCTAQLTQGNWYETQDGAYCCETCPDEEMAGASEPEPPPLPSPSPPPLGLRLAEPPPLATSRTASLVGLRRMMFENISHTDDEKLPGRGKSDVVVEPNKLNFSAKRPVEFNRNSSHRLSDSKIMKGDSGTVASNREIVKSDSVSHKTEIGSDFQCDSDPVSHTSSDSSRPKLVISHHTPEEDGIVVTTEVDEKDGFSSLNVTTDLRIVEAENADVVSVQKLDVDSDLEPNSCSSDLSVVQAKNEVINNSDDEIEYNKLVESKESIENNTLETRSDTIPEETEKVEVKSVNNETEGLLSHAESGSLKDAPDEITENVDEFTSLTHNIEQLVIEAKNEDVINSSDEKGETVIAKDESVSEMLESEEKRDVSEPKVPTPSERVVKHKPPTPQARKVSRALVMPKEEKKKPLEDYPEELNPFGDDDDNNELKEKPASTNPFGSSDEEEEEDSSLRKEENVPKPAARKVVPAPKINLNPFWSGDEEEEEENTTPIPKPRKLRTPKPSPEPSPQPRRLRSATGSLGSSSSIASRKKKPAPLPPNWHTLGTPGSRKSYSAPRPPHHPRTVTPSPPPLPTSSPPTSRPASPLPHDDKQFFNRQRQNSIVSETSSIGTISSYTPHKSMYGQWKRKKGPAPARPVPVRRAVQPMPLASVRQELADIEIKQQGLERQGVKLEQTIRDKFEQEGASLTPYVEEMVLQLFELVNEKNELFRRQAELMYLRRQHNLEEEHAELEYQIRCLMLCPEHNKTDSDKEKEEQLIQRLVEVVERRNEIIDCLEMDRLREKEEDRSVGTQLGIFSAAMGSEVDLRVKTDKKGKKWKKEKRWSKRDLDKEVEDAGDKKKSKKKWFTLHHSAKS